MRDMIEKYRYHWASTMHPLECERRCIQKGGTWARNDGVICGNGLFFHYKKFIEICWPEFLQHRWFDLILENYLAHEWMGLTGPKNSTKTGSMAVILLTDYYCHSSNTTVILSSTTMEGLDNRIFGEVKMRHRAAKNRCVFLPGYLIEGRRRIVTSHHDEFTEGRDFRCGFIGIAIRQGDKNAMENVVGIKNKRKRWFIDELQTLPASALDGTANFMEPGADCKFIGAGNPSDIMDAHGKLCEPHASLGGWDSNIDQEGKTKVWRTRFDNGICVQLPGSDSPNMDVGPNDPVPYPFLMTLERMEKDARTWGKTDWHFQMFNEGRWPRGQGASRVITRQMCINGHALDEAMWASATKTRIICMDAGYGGDRCVAHELHFGYEAWRPPHPGAMAADGIISQVPPTNDGRQIIALIKTWIVPIEGSDVKGAEDQIVVWSKKTCEERGIPPHNFFYEPGMRTSLVQKMTQLWSTKPVAIDFGGKPSEGTVSAEIQTSCRDYYFNFVTELWYSVRLIIESEQFRGLDEETMKEGCQREYKRVGGNKIQIETKADFKEKAGYSPDRFDALVTGICGAKMRGFAIRRMNAPAAEEEDQLWKLKLRDQAKAFHEDGELTFS
jgi:hypothetical protein